MIVWFTPRTPRDKPKRVFLGALGVSGVNLGLRGSDDNPRAYGTAESIVCKDLEATGGEKILKDIERGHDENV